jgi:radical SAM superfamily enzyme YgiQ (UPF0313 family)
MIENKIVLIQLPSPWLISDRDVPNLGLLYIASYLQSKEIIVQIADLCGRKEEDWQIPDSNIYGISATTPQIKLAKKVVEKIKNRQRFSKIIIGGPHVSAIPEDGINYVGANIVVMGEGEISLEQIIKEENNNSIITGTPLLTLDKSPLPARDLIDIYSFQRMGTNAVVGRNAHTEEYILTSRGCPYRCGYCSQRVISNGKIRYRSVKDVRKEMEYLLYRYNLDRIYIMDDTFILNKERVKEICLSIKELLEKYSFDWHCLSTTKSINKEILIEMKESNCKQVTFGVESGSNKILKLVNKPSTNEDNHRGIEETINSGIQVRGQLMVGLPGETDETIRETENLIKFYPEVRWGVHIFVPMPGSEIWDFPEKFNFKFIKSTDWDNYHTIGKPGEWSAQHLHINSEQVVMWAEHLRDVAGKKNVYEYDQRRNQNEV